ncbi:hypothetical protein ACHAWF_002412 [Thalassiosira exigua]
MKFSTIIATASAIVGSVAASYDDATYYFEAELAADSAAVPSSAGSKSTGTATFAVNPADGTVLMDIAWEIVGRDYPIDHKNALIGIHIHSGDSYTNGPIVFGFCGQQQLPPFGGYCQQGWSSGSAQIATEYAGEICHITGPDTPCYMGGHSTTVDAVKALIHGEPMYVNIHTTKSFNANGDAGPLGLIRGQLIPTSNGGPVASASREMASDADAEALADVMMLRRRTRSEQHQI